MMRYQINGLSLSIRRGIRWRQLGAPPAPPPPPPPSSTITPVLKVSRVPDGAARQTVTVAADGTTTITGVAPMLLFLDARDTRCSATAADEVSAWWHLQYRLDYDETPGQTWPLTGKPYGYDEGEPIFGRVIESPDTKTYVLSVKNPNGSISTRTLTFVATAPPEATIIEPSAGAWPTWVDEAHYALRGDVNYWSFGDIVMGGHRDIVISKIGSGADPIISGFNPDGRDIRDFTDVVDPTRNVRLVDIDVGRFYLGAMGPQFCGVVRGRVRTFDSAAFSYIYEHDATTDARRANLRIPRGVFLWKTGEMVPPPAAGEYVPQYVMISMLRELVASGVDFWKNGGTGNHALRNTGKDHVISNSRLAAGVASASLVKHQAGNGVTPWTDSEDTVGTPTGTRAWEHRPAEFFVMRDMVYHRPGSVIPDICVGAGAENNDPGYGHGVIRFCAFSNSVAAGNLWQSFAGLDVQVNGQAHSTRNVRLADGTYVTQSAGAYINNVPVEMRGPYLYETVNTRPSLD